MKTRIYTGVAFAIALATPGVALAQDGGQETERFIGVSAGYHDLGVTDEDVEGFEFDDASPIIGIFAGVDFPVANNLFFGVEGNVHVGTDVIDAEYGGSARFGLRTDSGSKFYVRGGYQEVDIDPGEIIDVEFDDDLFDGIDTTDGDYLVGVGADLPIGPGAFRINLDTIAFDTVRASAGFALTF